MRIHAEVEASLLFGSC